MQRDDTDREEDRLTAQEDARDAAIEKPSYCSNCGREFWPEEDADLCSRCLIDDGPDYHWDHPDEIWGLR